MGKYVITQNRNGTLWVMLKATRNSGLAWRLMYGACIASLWQFDTWAGASKAAAVHNANVTPIMETDEAVRQDSVTL